MFFKLTLDIDSNQFCEVYFNIEIVKSWIVVEPLSPNLANMLMPKMTMCKTQYYSSGEQPILGVKSTCCIHILSLHATTIL